MCLSIANVSQATQKPTRPMTVYKVYQKYGRKTVGCYQNTGRISLRVGRFVKSNRSLITLTRSELKTKEVRYGLHAFVDKADAMEEVAQVYNMKDFPHFVVTMQGNPEDFVARGIGPQARNNVVFMKLKVLAVDKPKPPLY